MLASTWAQLRYLQTKGLLHSITVDGVHWFAREDVLRLAHSHDARVSDAFEMFVAGKRDLDVVLKLNMEPARARELHGEYLISASRIVLQLPATRSLDAWCSVYGVAPEAVDPRMLLAALETCLADPALRAICEDKVRQVTEREAVGDDRTQEAAGNAG